MVAPFSASVFIGRALVGGSFPRLVETTRILMQVRDIYMSYNDKITHTHKLEKNTNHDKALVV